MEKKHTKIEGIELVSGCALSEEEIEALKKDDFDWGVEIPSNEEEFDEGEFEDYLSELDEREINPDDIEFDPDEPVGGDNGVFSGLFV